MLFFSSFPSFQWLIVWRIITSPTGSDVSGVAHLTAVVGDDSVISMGVMDPNVTFVGGINIS